MREIIARIIAGITLGLVVALALLFAARHNPPPAARAPGPAHGGGGAVRGPAPAPAVERGRSVYAAEGCASCHAIAGRGNPRYPLDGVGARRSAPALREFVTATGGAEAALPAAVVRRKARFRELPEDDLAALVHYLASLPAPP